VRRLVRFCNRAARHLQRYAMPNLPTEVCAPGRERAPGANETGANAGRTKKRNHAPFDTTKNT
jgi:hypothetical protein